MSSFFNKLASKLDDLDLGGKDKDESHSRKYSWSLSAGCGQETHTAAESRDYPPPSHQYGPPGGGPPQPYGYPGQHQQSYGSPPPPEGYHQQSYGGPPPPSQEPVYSHPEGKPPLPHGWVPQWDAKYQRWYYAEEATGHTQWEAPGARGPDSRGWAPPSDQGAPPHGAPSYGGYGQGPHDSDTRGSSGYGQHGDGGYGGYHDGGQPVEKKKKDHTLLYAAGGLAAGAIGGALIANALSMPNPDNPFKATLEQQIQAWEFR